MRMLAALLSLALLGVSPVTAWAQSVKMGAVVPLTGRYGAGGAQIRAGYEFAVERIKRELLPRYPHVDDVVGLAHTYGCGVAIDAPDAVIPIRTVRNISLNPNFGGEVMVVSLGCEKLQPERLMPPGVIPIADQRSPIHHETLRERACASVATKPVTVRMSSEVPSADLMDRSRT